MDGVVSNVQSSRDLNFGAYVLLEVDAAVNEVAFEATVGAFTGDDGELPILELHDLSGEGVRHLLGVPHRLGVLSLLSVRIMVCLRMQRGRELTDGGDEEQGCQRSEKGAPFDLDRIVDSSFHLFMLGI